MLSAGVDEAESTFDQWSDTTGLSDATGRAIVGLQQRGAIIRKQYFHLHKVTRICSILLSSFDSG